MASPPRALGPGPRRRPRPLTLRTLILYKLGSSLARALPAGVADDVARAVGAAAVVASPARRRQVERNLARVGGPVSRRAVRQTFQSYARYWVESFRLPGTPAATLATGMATEGFEHLERGVAAGRGVIVALPHLGGWEWAGFWLTTSRGLPVSVVVEALEPREVFDWFAYLRRQFGMHVIPLGPKAGGDVLRALAAGHIVCLLCDRDLDGGGVSVEFFGEPTTLPGGPATLALRTGAPLVPAAVYYRDGVHAAVIRAPVPVERQGRLRDDVTRVTQALAHELEALIRLAPEQWHLMQPNWPSDPGYSRQRRSAGQNRPS